ncbi:MAG TPA: hypothetical protein VLB46_01420 [Pyrinomonadaceae bacterium]|nr:hypothetical protein [Pyrinomonadaceae bacterium]
MRPGIESKAFSLKLALATACVCLSALSTFASDGASRVVLRPEVSRSHRDELITRLRVITGLRSLSFDDNGSLRFGDKQTTGGSATARSLLAQAIAGPKVIILEDASSRTDVAFCRVVRGRWTRVESNQPPAFVVLIDFTDFHQLSGDAEARAAFDVGWGLLHELDHVVTDSEDADDAKAVGECEEHINRMRLEVGLPVRVDYFFSRAYLKADANFNARYVRLSFERQSKRYWLVWDATTVGGLLSDSQRALVR